MAGQITHYWDGTKLVVTSDSGTSSADLKGDMGIRGPQGCPSIVADTNGTVFAPAANAIKATASGGKSVTLNDISPITHPIKIQLKSKNILPFDYYGTSKTEKGVTYTINADGTVTLNGTATADGSFPFIVSWATKPAPVPVNGTYTISGITTGTNKYHLQVYVDGNSVAVVRTAPQTFEANGNITQLSFFYYAGAVFDNLVIKPQIEAGNVATEYTPYISDFSTVQVKRYGETEAENLETYTANIDGTVDNLLSVYPTTTLMPDACALIEEVEYNKDLEKVLANIGGSSWQEGYVQGATEYIVNITYDEENDGKYYAVANNVHLALWGNTGNTPVIPMLAYAYYDGYTEDCLGTVSARFRYDKSQDESSFLTMYDGMYDLFMQAPNYFEGNFGGQFDRNGTWHFNILASKM